MKMPDKKFLILNFMTPFIIRNMYFILLVSLTLNFVMPQPRERTFCSLGLAVHVNLDCYPQVVHVVQAEKGVLASTSSPDECSPVGGRDLTPLRSNICKNPASFRCVNAFGLSRRHFIRVVYSCVVHQSVCGGSLAQRESELAGVSEMSPATGSTGIVYSPAYKGEDGNVPPAADCSLIIALPPRSEARLWVADFRLPQSQSCKTSSLAISDTTDSVLDSVRHWSRRWYRCGSENPKSIYSSSRKTTAVKITFVTYQHKDYKGSRGFVIYYNITSLESNDVTTGSSNVSSPAPTVNVSISPSELKSGNETVVPFAPQNGFTTVIVGTALAGFVIVLCLAVLTYVCLKKYQKNQIFQRNLQMRYSSRDSTARDTPLRNDTGALLQPYYMGATTVADTTIRNKPVRPSTAMSHYPIYCEEFNEQSTVTNATYSTPTYNYCGIPTTEL